MQVAESKQGRYTLAATVGHAQIHAGPCRTAMHEGKQHLQVRKPLQV